FRTVHCDFGGDLRFLATRSNRFANSSFEQEVAMNLVRYIASRAPGVCAEDLRLPSLSALCLMLIVGVASAIPSSSAGAAPAIPFLPRIDYSTSGGPVSVAVVDLNADGRLDLAVVDKDSNAVSILLGRGEGTFGPKADFPVSAGPP